MSIFQREMSKKTKFLCGTCGFLAKYDYFGRNPPFCKALVLLEEAYIIKDPFTDDRKAIVLGSHCSNCSKAVCVSTNCSLFYTKRFCKQCVKENIEEFPLEVKEEIFRY